MKGWGIKNLHLAGSHELGGWRIEVMDSCGQGSPALPSTLPTAVVSHYAPMGTKCGIGRDGVDVGSAPVRYDLEQLGNARVLMCGHVFDPIAATDWAEGVFCCNPGVSYWEHNPQPAFALVDLDRRCVQVDSGCHLATYSFAQ
jgi:Icc-related predicted phosphoesterase